MSGMRRASPERVCSNGCGAEYNTEIDTGMPEGRLSRMAYPACALHCTPMFTTERAERGSSAVSPGCSSRFPRGDFEFVNKVAGGAIPTELVPVMRKGVQGVSRQGRIGWIVTWVCGLRLMTVPPTRWTHPTWLSNRRQSGPSAKPTRNRTRCSSTCAVALSWDQLRFRRSAGKSKSEARNNPVHI